jgi:hypothetical protein
MSKVQIKVLPHWEWDEKKPIWRTNHGSEGHISALNTHFQRG